MSVAFLEQHDRFECVITPVKLGGNDRHLHERKVQDDFPFQFDEEYAAAAVFFK